MTYQLILKNPTLNKLAQECGVIIDENNRKATASEIEFLLEQIVLECMEICTDQYQSDNGFARSNEGIRLANVIYERFGAENLPYHLKTFIKG